MYTGPDDTVLLNRACIARGMFPSALYIAAVNTAATLICYHHHVTRCDQTRLSLANNCSAVVVNAPRTFRRAMVNHAGSIFYI